jgi:hypothetical protein
LGSSSAKYSFCQSRLTVVIQIVAPKSSATFWESKLSHLGTTDPLFETSPLLLTWQDESSRTVLKFPSMALPSNLLAHIVDVHCHPTDGLISDESMRNLHITLLAQSTRSGDQRFTPSRIGARSSALSTRIFVSGWCAIYRYPIRTRSSLALVRQFSCLLYPACAHTQNNQDTIRGSHIRYLSNPYLQNMNITSSYLETPRPHLNPLKIMLFSKNLFLFFQNLSR